MTVSGARLCGPIGRQAKHPHGSDWPLMLLDIRVEPRRIAVPGRCPPIIAGFLYVCEGRARLGARATAVAAMQVAWFDPPPAVATIR